MIVRLATSLSLIATLALATPAASADPVPIPAARLQFTPPAGWEASEMRGPQFAMFNRGSAVSVEIMIPAVDATHTEASLEGEYVNRLHPRWRGRASLRVVRESRGSMRRGEVVSGGNRQRFIFVTARLGDRYLMAGIFLSASATRADEEAAHQLIDSARPIP